MAHPLRLRMLSLLTGQAMSAAELARALGVSHALASYHLRQLARAMVVEVAEERTHRGGREVRYRYRPRPPTEGRQPAGVLAAALPGALLLFVEAFTTELRRRAGAAAPAPKLSPLVADAQLWVDPNEWATVRRHLDREFRRLHDVATAPRSGGTVCVSLSAAVFEMEGDETAEFGRK